MLPGSVEEGAEPMAAYVASQLERGEEAAAGEAEVEAAGPGRPT
jgi:hypothetical protein